MDENPEVTEIRILKHNKLRQTDAKPAARPWRRYSRRYVSFKYQ